MRYKMLLTGRNKSVIDDFFKQADNKFETLTTSVRYTDVLGHLDYYKPDIFVFCIYNESVEAFTQMTNIKKQLNQHEIPFILIGSKEDCEEFERMAFRIADFVLIKPLTAEAITSRILTFMTGWNKQKAEKAKTKKQEQGLLDLIVSAESEDSGKKHILVVDDSPIMLKTLQENLRDYYNIATAISGKVALKFLEKKKTDLILLDYEMPEENGPAVLEKIRSDDAIKDIPVIFLTGVTDSGKIKEALVLKPQGYLLKPINREKLLEAITRVLG